MAKALIKHLPLRTSLIGVLLAFNLVGIFWPGAKNLAAENLSRWPWSGYWHSQMALAYFETGNESQALHELKLAKSHRQKAEAVINQPVVIRQEIAEWEKILKEKKYSKEVLIRLAFLNYLIFEDEAAQNYWQRAQYLDPTSETIIELGKIISSVQEL